MYQLGNDQDKTEQKNVQSNLPYWVVLKKLQDKAMSLLIPERQDYDVSYECCHFLVGCSETEL